MLSAKISNDVRKAVYRRDHFRCVLCDYDRGLQVHHVVSRGQGGTNYPQNLQPAEVCQACVEYVADLYTDLGFVWNPWEEHMQRWGP